MLEPMSVTFILFMTTVLIKRQAENTLIAKGLQKIIIHLFLFSFSMRTEYINTVKINFTLYPVHNILETLCVEWRNWRLCFASTPERKNENINLNKHFIFSNGYQIHKQLRLQSPFVRFQRLASVVVHSHINTVPVGRLIFQHF